MYSNNIGFELFSIIYKLFLKYKVLNVTILHVWNRVRLLPECSMVLNYA